MEFLSIALFVPTGTLTVTREARMNIPDGALLGLEILVLVKTKQSILDVM